MKPLNASELVFDWNAHGPEPTLLDLEFDDETLRDGLQSVAATDPTIDQKIEILHLM